MIEILNKLRIQENTHNLIKSIYEKPTPNIILIGGILKASPLRLGTRQICLLLQPLFKVVMEVLARKLGK